MARVAEVTIAPLTAQRWPDLEALFGPKGACAGCWCMWWRLAAKEWDAMQGEPNRLAFKTLVDAGEEPGLLAYVDGQPAGWCALAPRRAYVRLERMRIFKPVDDQAVWSVVCFFIGKGRRGYGLSRVLLQAAVDYARRHGARIIEGYPVEPKKEKVSPLFIYTGLASTFRQVGFVEVERRSATRPIMRYVVQD